MTRVLRGILILLGMAATAGEPVVPSEMDEVEQPLFGNTVAALKAANDAGAFFLAPKSYGEGVDLYRRAEKAFERGGRLETIREDLGEADSLFAKAIDYAEIAKVSVPAAIEAREDAKRAEASTYAPDLWRDAEERFEDAMVRLENGRMKSAMRLAGSAEERFRIVELAAIKSAYLDETRRELEVAEQVRAGRYAPASFAKAAELLAEADRALEEDRYDTDRPRTIARQAKHEAAHAVYVAKLARQVQKGDVSVEQVLREWELAFVRIADLADIAVFFDEGHGQATEAIVAAINGIRDRASSDASTLADAQSQIASMQQQITKLSQELGGGADSIKELEASLARQTRDRERYREVESLFTPDQALVLRQGSNVIVRMVGLSFDVGHSRIKTEHYPLLATLEQAISLFPESDVVIEGHTDAYGSDEANMALSQARAKAVETYLLSHPAMSPLRLQSIGYGESRPVANNETTAGRAKNRRIDIVIKPSAHLLGG